ncbi:MAG: N-acetyl-D-Glu racemase DgcA [Planktomarina sp.]
MQVTVRSDQFQLAQTFTIARGSRDVAQVLTVTVADGTATGRGECVPYARYEETLETVAGQIKAASFQNRDDLQTALSPGAARNALDCALWDLEAKRAGIPVWKLLNMHAPKPQVTAFTLSLDSPDAMHRQAAQNAHRPILKIKLGTPDDLPRLQAVRKGAPDACIIVDANEGWQLADYQALVPELLRCKVALVEQPLPAGQDATLKGLDRPVPICADESCHTADCLADLQGKYDVVNIKLDKAGGLTEALRLKADAQKMGFGIMVGCMVGSSLAMAPATLLAQGADYIDLDGPLLLTKDRSTPLEYDNAGVHPPHPDLWG